MTLKFITSNKGHKQLVHNGYIFGKYRNGKNKVIWRCEKYKEGCTVTCHTDSESKTGNLLNTPPKHDTHPLDMAKIEMKITVNKIKRSAVRNKETTSSVIAAKVATLSSPVAARLPRIDSLSRSLRHIRAAENPQPINPQRGTNFTIPDEFTTTMKGEEFWCTILTNNIVC